MNKKGRGWTKICVFHDGLSVTVVEAIDRVTSEAYTSTLRHRSIN